MSPPDLRTVDPTRPDPEVIGAAADLLRTGRLVAFPTETVYGLGADAGDDRAVGAVFRCKGRPATDPLIVHVVDSRAARAVVARWPARAEALAEAFWPGPLTLVLPSAGTVVAAVGAGLGTVAVRVPAHPVAQALLDAAGVPVAAPSANRFGRVSPTTAAHVVEELGDSVDLVLDGGPTPLGVESTVVAVGDDVVRVLRPGGVPVEDLAAVVGDVELRERTVVPEDTGAPAPGGFLRHYAPSVPLVLVEGDRRTVEDLRRALSGAGRAVGVVELPGSSDAAAHRLYAALREADATGAELLLVAPVDPAGLGRAVNDRLFRAAHGRVVLDAGPATVDRLARLLP